MRPRLRSLLLIPLMGVGLACAHYETVLVPPAVNLTQFPAVGLVRFSSSNPGLARYATQRFIQHLTEAQPGVRILELGSVEEVLAKVGKPRLDADAIREIGKSQNVQAVFTGSLDITAPQPSVSLSLGRSMGVSADVTGTLSAALHDTAQGAIVWTDSARNGDSAGGGGVGPGFIGIDVGGENNAYARIVRRAAFAVTDTFRSHEVTRRVQ